jgi:hypothetical protein
MTPTWYQVLRLAILKIVLRRKRNRRRRKAHKKSNYRLQQ